MNKWKVYNRHPQGLTHKERFRGDMIEIPAGSFVEMDYEDAVQFRGQYFPIVMTETQGQDPKSMKVIELVGPTGPAAQDTKERVYICHMDGKEFSSKQALEQHLKEKYGDVERVVDETLDEAIDSEMKTEAPENSPVRKKPGPKPREKTL